MDLSEVVLGLFMGILCGFFLVYSLQPQRPYPSFMLNLLYYPWTVVILLICITVLFFVDERVAILVTLIFLFFLIDIFFLGTERNRVLIKEREKPEETHYPINTNEMGLDKKK